MDQQQVSQLLVQAEYAGTDQQQVSQLLAQVECAGAERQQVSQLAAQFEFDEPARQQVSRVVVQVEVDHWALVTFYKKIDEAFAEVGFADRSSGALGELYMRVA